MSKLITEIRPQTREIIEKHLEGLSYSEIEIDVEKGSAKGDNYLGIITKATVKAKSKEGVKRTFHWIIKNASDNEEFRLLMHIKNLFTREIYIYQSVFPEFFKLQDELNIKDRFENVPHVHTIFDGVPETIIMEDLKEQGYVMLNRRKPLDYDHCMMALKEYAKFHALSFALKHKRPGVFKQLSDNLHENFFSVMGVEGMNINMANLNDKVFKAMKPEDEEALDKFKKYSENAFGMAVDQIQAESAGEYAVVTHGDSWVNNILYKYDDKSQPEVPTSLSIIDFQMSRLGSPALDLIYFIFTCTSKELRDSHLQEMLQVYHKSLTDFLRQFSLDTEKVYPYSILQDHMRQFSAYGLMMTIMVTHLMMSEGDETPDLENADLTDHAGFESSFIYESKNEALFGERIRDVVIDMAAQNYI
ncbi:PREDICTED: uncharacterized protein LOC108556296 [Nicrophorus vespilloides]|uniref:Uncharacterized protein LOC108556296 n=1 Tax=Nicrophorus vespilloides TaxID=110193 RepID=A0ABM1LZT2_NICVS|nr:PREDICTED: uncharacterized protein LOC108556296 [Nicrophorus vespilloides]